jgi:Tfp pilus assembly protein PilV
MEMNMKTNWRNASPGFVLIEALVAILIVALGVLALAQLESHIMGAAGESKARSTAMALARSKIDELRGSILQSQYVGALVTGSQNNITKDGIAFNATWTISKPNANLDNHLVQVVVNWTDRAGNTQKVDLNSLVAWNDPALGLATLTELGKNLIAPTGAAKRGPGVYRPGDQTPTVVTGNDGVTRLLNSAGDAILYLNPTSSGGTSTPQYFTTINGRVLFDQSETNGLPAIDHVFVRLSSEGECIYDNSSTQLAVLPAGANGNAIKYKYFSYKCYVGPGWYGNVGVTIINDNANPTICVGDPTFTDASFTASPAAVPSTTRGYRGFRQETSGQTVTFISTGMPGGRVYGNDGDVNTEKDGKPKPSDFALYGITAGDPANYFNQDFLVSKITGQGSCAGKMAQIANANTFSPNAGKYYCIAPDKWSIDNPNDATGNRCPNTWPGFPSSACSITVAGSFDPGQVPSGSTATNVVTCSVTDSSSCVCTTTSGTANYSCATTGGSSQTITVQAVRTTTAWNAATLPQCIPSSSCAKPADTSTVQYQCAQSGCTQGTSLLQSRTVSAGSWSSPGTQYQNQNTCLANKPADTDTTKYRCGGNGSKYLQSQTLTLGTWSDMANTCVGTSAVQPDDTATTRYSWLAGTGSNGCASGTKQLQVQSANGLPTDATYTKTSGILNCTSLNSFNIP